MSEYVEHVNIKENAIENREYQEDLTKEGLNESSLIVLPTGTGKTIVALRISAHQLDKSESAQVLFLAPTKPLVDQHYETYSSLLTTDDIHKFSGDIRPEKRQKLWETNPDVVIATPQVIQNDLIQDRISLDNVKHLVFDECHRAKGEYPYVYISEKYRQQNGLITGLSASPGSDKDSILQICDNIGVKSINVITENDPRLDEYTHDISVEPKFIEISDTVIEARDLLQDLYKEQLQQLYNDDYIDTRAKKTSQKKLNRARGNIQKAMQKGDGNAYQAMSVWSEASKLRRAIDLIESQGPESFIDYHKRLQQELQSDDPSNAVQRLLTNDTYLKAVDKMETFVNGDNEYSKIQSLRAELVNEIKINGGKAIVFTKSRDTVETLYEKLTDTFDVGRLVGQSDTETSDGMTQREQKETIKMFDEGTYNVLLSTQVGEEGLDMTEVDLVVFYEPAAKSIEQVQRRGRTGRSKDGRVIILVAKKTKDEGMFYKSKNDLDQMENDVKELQNISNLQEEINDELRDQQQTLDDFATTDDTYTILADSRETSSSVVRKLDKSDDVTVEIVSNMEVGDYIVSNDTAVERKSADDFLDTLTGNRSIFEQVKNMNDSYEKSILIVENYNKIYEGNVHPNAIDGAISSLVSDFNVSIIPVVDEDGTYRQLKYLAKREQDTTDTTVNPHGNKQTQSLQDQQEYIVSSIEDIGPKTAKRLLQTFDSVYNIFTADVDELQSVENVGKTTAEKIHNTIRSSYSDSER